MIVKNLDLRVAVRLDQTEIEHERRRHRRLGDVTADRERIKRRDSEVSRAQRPGPIQRAAPDQPAQQYGRPRKADQAAEAADIFHRLLLELAQCLIEVVERRCFGGDELLEEQRRDALPGALDGDRADRFRTDIQARPRQRQIQGAQFRPATPDQRERLHPNRSPADRRSAGGARGNQWGDVDSPRTPHDVALLAEMNEVVHPPSLQRHRLVTTLRAHQLLMPPPHRGVLSPAVS